MPITSGTRLGPYQVTAKIGAGGMGEVYKATDTRLSRTVAIKVLPEHLASDPDRLARFRREAQTISSLNHPHICALYDVGEEHGRHFLVMEYVEGGTLADRIAVGPLPLDDAVAYASQMADALKTAHERGIIHRDLKPGNVMVTASGVKLLDFGLAKFGAGPPLGPAANRTNPDVTRSTSGRFPILPEASRRCPPTVEALRAGAGTAASSTTCRLQAS